MPAINTGALFAASALALAALLSGCGANDSAEGPGGVTAGEARALNEAAAMLDARTDNALAAQTGNTLSGEDNQ